MADKLIPLTGLWENESKNGTCYFAGVLGKAKILLLPNKDKQKDTDPGWMLFIAERPPKPQQTQAGTPRQDGAPRALWDDLTTDPGEPVRRRRPYEETREF